MWALSALETRTMSLSSRLSSLFRTAARSPAVRRGVRDLGRAAVRAVQDRQGTTQETGKRGRGADRPAPSQPPRQVPGSSQGSGPTGQILADRDPARAASISYSPNADDRPDPGEIVWAWVHYEEDLGQGKDRPVLVLAEEPASAGGSDGSGSVLVALMLTSRDRAETGEVITDQHGATWVDIGAGDWDGRGRPSEVRADRLLRLDPSTVRREGGRLGRERFDRVAAAVRELHGWRG